MYKKILLMVCVGSLMVLSSCSEQKVPFFNDHVIQMWAQTLQPYSVDIAFFGDSRVALGTWEEAFADSDVVNLGIGGDIIEGTIQRLPLLEALDVRYCFLAIGANNCSRDTFSAVEFRNNYTVLLHGLEKLGISIYVNTIAGVTTVNSSIGAALAARMNANIIVANEIIRDLADKSAIPLIDMATVMNNADGSLKTEYSVDGIHFSDAGNQVWYDSLRPYIEAIP